MLPYGCCVPLMVKGIPSTVHVLVVCINHPLYVVNWAVLHHPMHGTYINNHAPGVKTVK